MIHLNDAFALFLEKGRQCDLKAREQATVQEYPDSGIVFCADVSQPIRKIAAMINCTPFDIFFAKEQGCDLVLTHHPIGKTIAGLPDMILQQSDNISPYGVDPGAVRGVLETASEKLRRELSGSNFFCEEQIAKLIGISVGNIHTLADNAAVQVLSEKLAPLSSGTLGDALRVLSEIFEYREASKRGNGPYIVLGEPSSPLGRIALSEFVGGQESDPLMIRALAEAGIQTILCPHFSEEYFAMAKQMGLNLLYCGHLASDSIGMNVLLDALLERDPSISVVSYGGLIRKES